MPFFPFSPHKERLAIERSEHPTAIRFHRACSWMSEVEQLDPIRHADQILLHQWIAFNALYGQWDQTALEPAADRRSWQAFLGQVHALDRSSHLVSVLQDNKPLVLCILEDEYLNQYFWQDPSAKSASRARNGRHKAQSWYVEGRWLNPPSADFQLRSSNCTLDESESQWDAHCIRPPAVLCWVSIGGAGHEQFAAMRSWLMSLGRLDVNSFSTARVATEAEQLPNLF